jgi:2OG-Fe(II) oxygenase superfamily
VQIVILDEFLVREEWEGLLEFTARNIRSPGEALSDLGSCHWSFTERLISAMPHVLERLGRPGLPLASLEFELAARSNRENTGLRDGRDGDEYSSREIAFVYFLHHHPQRFSGGEMRIYNAARDHGPRQANGPYSIIYPIPNQIAFFGSECLTEELPVECLSPRVEDGLFAVRGWFHR